MSLFVVINTHEDDAVFSKQVTGEVEARVHHVQPVAVVAARGLRVGRDLPTLAVYLTGVFEIRLQALAVVVGIDEIIAGVVRRVDVDHLDLAVVALLHEFQDFEIVALDDQVLRGVPIDAALGIGAEGCHGGRLDGAHRLGLAGPLETEALVLRLDPVAERAAEGFEIDLAVAEDLGEILTEHGDAVGGDIHGGEIEPGGGVCVGGHGVLLRDGLRANHEAMIRVMDGSS